jgi:hypothetical protein
MAGSGSQTTNGVILSVCNDTIRGSTQPGLVVMLLSDDYSPLSDIGYRAQITVGADSVFEFTGLEKGKKYGLLTVFPDSTKGLYISDLIPHFDSTSFVRKVFLFDSLGSVSGSIKDLSGKNQGNVVEVYIRGTPFIGYFDSQRRFYIDNCPLGKFYIVAVLVPNKSVSLGKKSITKEIVIDKKGTEYIIDISEIIDN